MLPILILSVPILMFAFIRSIAFNKGKFGPYSLFFLSFVTFLWSRPLLSVFGYDKEIVQAGAIREEVIESTLVVLSASLAIILAIGFFATDLCKSAQTAISNSLTFSYLNSLQYPKLSNAFILGSLICGLFFLLESYKRLNSGALAADYSATISDPSMSSHFYLFFTAKHLSILSLITRGNLTLKFTSLLAFFLFLSSLGFVMIGLRGYTYAYFFLFLFFFVAFKNINIWLLIGIGAILMIASVAVLEMRVGFGLSSGIGDALTLGIHSQGATFEVVYGMVGFGEEVRNTLINTLIPPANFGDYIDEARGVNFSSGAGFASSGFAESLLYGIPGLVLYSIVLGIAIRFLDSASLQIQPSAIGRKVSSKGWILLLFALVPNLVYLCRSSMFDLLSKLFVIGLLIAIFDIFLFSNRLKPSREV